MVIERLSSKAVQIYRAVSRSATKGSNYVSNSFMDLLSGHTQIGRRVSAGIRYAKESARNKMIALVKNETGTFTRYMGNVETNGSKIAEKLSHDSEFMKLYERYAQKTGIANVSLIGKTDEALLQELIETSGVGPTKFAQIISSDAGIMSKIENPALRTAIQNTRSNCSFSRTIEEAQQVLEKSFPNSGFVIEKELSAGSIGAAYIVRKPDGTTAVLKMLKKGVDKEQLELEERLFTRLIGEFGTSTEEVAKHRLALKNMYRDWGEELNFSSEYANNKLLAKGAERYKVADITHISEDGSCIVMNKANGIQMNKLVEMLNFYKSNPSEFAAKYAEQIKANPWLADPERVARDLPTTLLKTFDEQFMFMKKGGYSIMHGDPHTGNFFITADAKGKLIPEFIDTGNCVRRTSAQIKDDINFFTNYFVGNSKGVAKYFVEQCGYKGANKAELTEKIAQEIQSTIFGKPQNVTQFEQFRTNMNYILEKHGLALSCENATAMKAQMQFFTAISEAGSLTGRTSVDIATLLKDIPQASWGMLKNGTNPWGSIKEALKYAYYNQRQAVGTAYQFTLGDIDRLIKSDGSLSTVV